MINCFMSLNIKIVFGTKVGGISIHMRYRSLTKSYLVLTDKRIEVKLYTFARKLIE